MKRTSSKRSSRTSQTSRLSATASSWPPTGIQLALALLLLIAAPLIVLWPVFQSEFTNLDDVDQVRDNPSLAHLDSDSIATWWTTPRMDMYMPVTYSVWGIVALSASEAATDDAPAHLDPGPFHAANLSAHVLCGLVVFALLQLAIRDIWPAVIGALLFELHPVQVEPVAWVAEFNTVLSGLFALAAVWQYLLAARSQRDARDGRARRWHYLTGLFLYALAILAKPIAVVAPLMAATMDRLIVGRSWKAAAKWLWPWGVLAIGCALETLLFQNGGGAKWNVAWYLRPLVAMDSIAFYLSQLVWPRYLMPDYGLRPDVLLHDHWLIPKCFLLLLLAGSIGQLRKSTPIILAGFLLFLIPLLPVLGLITFDFQWYSNVSDHYLYLPLLGLALIVAWYCRRFHNRAVYGCAVLILAVLGWTSNAQSRIWADTNTLFTYNLKVNPASALAMNQFTRLWLDRGNAPKALEFARKEVVRHPDDTFAWRVQGLCLWQLHQQAAAISAYQQALTLSPDDALTLEDFAGAMLQVGRLGEAESLARHMMAVDPDFAEGRVNFGFILRAEKKFPEAIEEFQSAIRLDPTSVKAHNLLAQSLEDSGQKDAALEQYQIAARLNPDSQPAIAGVHRLSGQQ